MNRRLARALRILSCCAVFAAGFNLAVASGWRMPLGATGLAVLLAMAADWVQRPDKPTAEPADMPESEDAHSGGTQ